MVCEHRLRPHKQNTNRRPGLPSPLALGYDFSPLDVTSVVLCATCLTPCLHMENDAEISSSCVLGSFDPAGTFYCYLADSC